jgi:hypothetical protein
VSSKGWTQAFSGDATKLSLMALAKHQGHAVAQQVEPASPKRDAGDVPICIKLCLLRHGGLATRRAEFS